MAFAARFRPNSSHVSAPAIRPLRRDDRRPSPHRDVARRHETRASALLVRGRRGDRSEGRGGVHRPQHVWDTPGHDRGAPRRGAPDRPPAHAPRGRRPNRGRLRQAIWSRDPGSRGGSGLRERGALARRGRGQPPPLPARLLGALRDAVLEADEKLEQAVNGLSDEDAYRPERPGAWSVAQLLAHLSITERMLQSWLDEAARGERPGID